MLDRPRRHCPCGSYEHVVPVPTLQHRVEYIDYCVVDIVAALNAANIHTVASCCGHGVREGTVLLEDGRELVIQQSVVYYPEIEGDNRAKRRA